MATRKTKKSVDDGGDGVRGGGIADETYAMDFGARTESFTVDTRVDKRFGQGGNEREFDDFIAKLRGVREGTIPSTARLMREMIAFLDSEVETFKGLESDQLKAKNIFRAAFGLPFVRAASISGKKRR